MVLTTAGTGGFYLHWDYVQVSVTDSTAVTAIVSDSHCDNCKDSDT